MLPSLGKRTRRSSTSPYASLRTASTLLLTGTLGLTGIVGTTLVPQAAAAAPAQTQWVVNGPSEVQGTLQLDGDGALHLEVRDDGRPLYTVDDLGVVSDGGDLSHGLTFLDRQVRPVHDSYTLLAGKRQERRYQATETVFSFADDGGDRLGVAVRI